MTPDTVLLPEIPIVELGTQLAEGGTVSEHLYFGESGLWRLGLGAWINTREIPAIWSVEGGLVALPDAAASAIAWRGQYLWCLALGGELLQRQDISEFIGHN